MNTRNARARRMARFVAAALALALAGCLEVASDLENDGGAGDACDRCHSSVGDTPAHAAHVSGACAWGQQYACADCHPVPAAGVPDGTHANAFVEVVFPEGGLASADGAAPAWDGAACAGVYCHGATLGGGAYTEPAWADVPTDGIVCGDCHATPPPAPHPQADSCGACHEAGMAGGAPNPATHIDGQVQLDDGGEDDVGARP